MRRLDRRTDDAMWVKICGNTNLEDAAMAAKLGANAVGFVFAASKRQVTVAQVAAMTANLPDGVEKVGVFDAHDPDLIANAAQVAGLTAVQLHGGFDEELLEHMPEILAPRVQIIQTLHWTLGDASSSSRIAQELERLAALGIADRVLIDSKVGAAGGGTGVAFEWAKAREVFASAPDCLRLILAGGLKPENVGQAIGELRPWGVDVCSGVEAAPGRKDPVRLAQFIENAHAAITP
jgi:phosphoribosylanthranilate isomerase